MKGKYHNYVELVSVWIIYLTAALAIFFSFCFLIKPEPTSEERLEKHGYCDVIYYAFEDGKKVQHSWSLGMTPIMGIGVIWHDDAPSMTFMGDVDPNLMTWLAEVVRVTTSDENPWRIIEIDVLYEHCCGLSLSGTVLITRARRLDGTKQYLDDLNPEEAVYEWLESGNIMVINTLSYPRQYTRGFNCSRKPTDENS